MVQKLIVNNQAHTLKHVLSEKQYQLQWKNQDKHSKTPSQKNTIKDVQNKNQNPKKSESTTQELIKKENSDPIVKTQESLEQKLLEYEILLP